MKKRILFVALTVAALCAVFALTASAATRCGDYYYTVSNGEATITDVDPYIAGDVVIPSTLDGYPVTSVSIASCSNLTSVTIPEGVTSVSIRDCSSLTSVTIPEGVTSIGSFAFSGCSSLTSVTIPSSVTSIGSSAFDGCSSLTSVTIPSSVTSIGNYAFSGCSSLTSVTIPSSVTSIGSDAFYWCNSLTSIAVDSENSYYTDVDGVLFNKAKTALIQYPAGNTRTDYTIPSSVTIIGDHAFYNCSSLTSVTIPSSVTSIGSGAFSGCSSLTSVTIPSSVTSIDSYAFSGCSSLTSVTIPSSVTSIGSFAFSGCSSLTSVTIPSSVTSIGEHAFSWCSSLTSVTIQEGVKSIDADAFWNCSSLTSVTIPSSVTSIGYSAFSSGYSYNLTIYGYSGSTAETYAANKSITFVALDGNAVAPAITTQPQGSNAWNNTCIYYAGDNAAPMTVEAVAYGGGALSYAWYKADSADGEGVKVGDTASCTPDVATVGTAYYYVVVTNTWTNINNITTTASTKSDVITVTVNSIAPVIQFQTSGPVNCYPGNSTFLPGMGGSALSVSASAPGLGTLSYAWYRAGSADGEGVKVGEGQSHVPDTTVAGTYYYYAIVTNTRTNDAGVTATASTKSAVITVIVHARTVLSGSYTSYDPDAPARIELLRDGNFQMETYSSLPNSGSGQATLNFTFTLTTPGTYDLRIVKGGHLTATVTGITVDGTSDVTLDPITLSAGDLNGDGVINVTDVALLRMADNYGKSADDLVSTFGD